jgi:diguanylate cyclase
MEAVSVRDVRLVVNGATPVNEGQAPDPRQVVPPDRAAVFFPYVGAVVLGGIGVVASDLGTLAASVGALPVSFWVIAALAVVVDARPLAARAPAEARDDAGVFGSIAFTFAILLGWGLALAVVVQVAAVIVSSVRLRHAVWRGAFNAGQYTMAFAAASLVLTVAGGAAQDGLLSVAVVVLAAGVWFAVNEVLVATAVWILFGGRWLRTLGRRLRPKVLSTLALLALGPIVAAAGDVNAALVPLMLIPLWAVSELARTHEVERHKARIDELTGLPNRGALFAEMQTQARTYAERAASSRRMALLMLDIAQFRRVNDALGHAVGDRLLEAVAQRLRECIGADGFVARLGGDEFAVLAPRLLDQTAAAVLAERVADALSEPVTLDGLPLDVTAAIGVAIHPEHGHDSTSLLRHAEVAMYDAKDRAATYAIYAPESDQNSPERLELLADLRRALDSTRSDEIELYYQPQVDMATEEVVGIEALLRWRHPRRGPVSPDQVIKVTEHTAVMRRLTSRVLQDSIGQLAEWNRQGLVLRASVNVSVRDLQRPELVDQLADMLADRGVTPNQIQLEITEGALMADPRRVLVTLHRLDKLGVALSLDDFGTGYSSLQHLRRLPLAEVKIDRSFVLGMATDQDDAAVVGSIIDLARALGLRVVAEGVEDDRTRRMLLSSGCEVAQGWYYARPMPADAFTKWLADYRPPRLLGKDMRWPDDLR